MSQVVGLSEAQVATVATIEQDSPHPIAQAIKAYHQPSETAVTDLKNIAGYGVRAVAGGKTWLVGSTRLLEHEGVSYPVGLKEVVGTMVAIAIDGQYAGHIVLSDCPKQDATQAIENLKRQGIETVMLAMSDVGIAMGGLGSDMAVETADVVIQTDQPSRVADAVALGRRTRRIVTQNIAFAIGVKVLVMILGVLGIANLWEAVFADVGVALLCVLNSLRLMRLSDNE